MTTYILSMIYKVLTISGLKVKDKLHNQQEIKQTIKKLDTHRNMYLRILLHMLVDSYMRHRLTTAMASHRIIHMYVGQLKDFLPPRCTQ